MLNTEAQKVDVPQVAPARDPMIHDLHARVTKLEHRTSEDRLNFAVLVNDLSYVKSEVTGISKGINRVLWSIGVCVITAGTTFVLSGGLNILGTS